MISIVTPSKAQAIFESYIHLLSSCADHETIQEINIQIAFDNRLTFNQREALFAISNVKDNLIFRESLSQPLEKVASKTGDS